MYNLVQSSCDEFTKYAQTGIDDSGDLIPVLADASDFRTILIQNIMSFNILIAVEQDANRGAFAAATPTKRSAHVKSIISNYTHAPYAMFAVDFAVFNLIRVAYQDLEEAKRNSLLDTSCEYVMSALAQYAYSPHILSCPHLRSQQQKQNIAHKLALDGYTMGLVIDTVVIQM